MTVLHHEISSTPGNAAALVSVIVPAFNEASVIPDAISSALAQTVRCLEVIVVDDGSTDGTVDVVRRFAEADTRVRLVEMPRNAGPAAARNAGVAAARGDWIALLDADDVYEPTRIDTLLALAKANDADIVSDNLLVHSADVPPYPLIPADDLPAQQQLTAAAFVQGNLDRVANRHASYGFMQPMIRHDFLLRHGLRYDDRNRFGEDYMFYLACFRAGARWWVTPETLYAYRTRANSLTSRQSLDDLVRVAESDHAFLTDPVAADDAVLRRALRRHRAKVDRIRGYELFSSAVKDERWGDAWRMLTGSMRMAGLITQEALRRAPRVARKVALGGYRAAGT